ncbi:hypothetical protein [uncultured Fibrobacter sp.]|jgi:hypothetical protein|uniref:hypothetical protein n=1 Tax=uncultured Fibrobacter sp. TaxID=261512 RepID=UPI0025CE639B|nr:hypothetical protein [uncultured Fibrobacter sp.]
MRRKRKYKRKHDPFRTYEEAHSYGRAIGYLSYMYEMAVKMRDSKEFDLSLIAKYTELPIKTILVL